MLIGGGTLRAEDPPLLIRDPEVRDRRVAAKGSPHPRNITVCSMLPENLAAMNFFRSPETEKLVFTTERTPPDLREAASQYARIEVVPLDSSGRVDLVEVLRRLPSLGVCHLLLEGGGELNFSMLAGRPDRRNLPDHLPVRLRRPHRPDLVRRRRLHPRTRPQARPEESPPECQRRGLSPLRSAPRHPRTGGEPAISGRL